MEYESAHRIQIRDMSGQPNDFKYHENRGDDTPLCGIMRFNAPQFFLTMTFERTGLASQAVIENGGHRDWRRADDGGSFTSHYGQTINLPIVRGGGIASKDWEKIRDVTGQYFDA
ncbi:MAG: hypothetical protein ACR2QA_02845 [Solirubrobacteraceae bacterium]